MRATPVLLDLESKWVSLKGGLSQWMRGVRTKRPIQEKVASIGQIYPHGAATFKLALGRGK